MTVNGSVTVVDQNASDFAVMVPVPATYDIFIWTTDGALPMADVTVVLDGETIVTSIEKGMDASIKSLQFVDGAIPKFSNDSFT